VSGSAVRKIDLGGVTRKSPARTRSALPLAVTAWAVLVCLVGQVAQPGFVDFRYFWHAGLAISHGLDPYVLVDNLPGKYPLYYPGPAVLVLAPFGLLPIRVAWVAWAALGGLVYGLACQRYGRGLAVGCLSAGFLEAVIYGQWSPLIVGAAVVPWLAGLVAAKPSIGTALFAWRPDARTVWAGLGLTAASLVVMPSWPREWLHSLTQANQVAPVLRPWGWILVFAGLRWRTPEGRLLFVLALIPQTTALYETLILFLIPRNRYEGYGLAGLSFVAAIVQGEWVHGVTIEAGLAARWPVIFSLIWLPALALVLAPRRFPD